MTKDSFRHEGAEYDIYYSGKALIVLCGIIMCQNVSDTIKICNQKFSEIKNALLISYPVNMEWTCTCDVCI